MNISGEGELTEKSAFLTSLHYEESIEESQQESSATGSASGGPSSASSSPARDVVRTDLLEGYKPKTTDSLNEKNRVCHW